MTGDLSTQVTTAEVEEYMKTFEKKMGGFLVVRGDLTTEEATKFGLKVEQDEVEKFIAANTQELGKVSRLQGFFNLMISFV